jgi:hypothetical protein
MGKSVARVDPDRPVKVITVVSGQLGCRGYVLARESTFRQMETSAEWGARLDAIERGGWVEYLDSHSGLPGPRANLTLLDAVARIADERTIEELIQDGREYPTMCAAAATGRLAGDREAEARLRALAMDERWRVREGVVIGLQILADSSPNATNDIVGRWADDPSLYVQRAAVATICEPRLLHSRSSAAIAVDVCRRATHHLTQLPRARRTSAEARTLRQALGYCWSVAVAADPTPGLAAFHALDPDDPDVAWIVKENLRKKRLSRLLVPS